MSQKILVDFDEFKRVSAVHIGITPDAGADFRFIYNSDTGFVDQLTIKGTNRQIRAAMPLFELVNRKYIDQINNIQNIHNIETIEDINNIAYIASINSVGTMGKINSGIVATNLIANGDLANLTSDYWLNSPPCQAYGGLNFMVLDPNDPDNTVYTTGQTVPPYYADTLKLTFNASTMGSAANTLTLVLNFTDDTQETQNFTAPIGSGQFFAETTTHKRLRNISFLAGVAGSKIGITAVSGLIENGVSVSSMVNPNSYKFIVRKEGSSFFTYNRDGAKVGSGTSLADQINGNAIAGLTASRAHKEVIYLQGLLDGLDDTITFDDHTGFIIDGLLQSAAELDKPMFVYGGTVPHDISFMGGGTLDNMTDQNSGNGIEIAQTGAGSWLDCELIFSNLKVKAKDIALKIENTGSGQAPNPQLNTLRLHGLSSYGLYLKNVTDFVGSALDIGGSAEALYLYGVASGSISGIRTDGGYKLIGLTNFNISGAFVDLFSRNIDGIYAENIKDCTLAGSMIRADGSDGYNTKSAIHFYSNNCINNTIMGFKCGRPSGSAVTNRWAYGINEDNSWGTSPDYNRYVGVVTRDCINADVLGANSTSI